MAKPTKKILIVDDDADSRQAVSLSLQEQDYIRIEISESADVDSAIQQMKNIKPDIVILDLHMPGKNGFDFMNIINKTKTFANTKIIMLTADDTSDTVFKAVNVGIGAFQYLNKPFNITDLHALVFGLSFLGKI
jgi:DNA-binding response OmpR family regulator